MNCTFCQQPTRLGRNYTNHHCKSCRCVFRDNSVTLKTTIKDKSWSVEYRYRNSQLHIVLIRQGKQKPMVYTKTDPHITPSNIKDKLSTYLVFS